MPIQSGDVRLVKSKVMLDTPEGGGGPTGNVVEDGVSNDVFPDVSAMDRVNGRVNARQLHLHINTPTTDMYLGANLIVSRPPNDANISVTMVDTGETFDTRDSAIARMEAYLFVGTPWAGFLFGNHLAGMQVVSIVQRTQVVPAIGEALVLTKREGYSDEYRQYIRVIAVSAVETEFEDVEGIYKRWVVSLSLSDPLRVDFPGFDPTRFDPSSDAMRLRTKTSKTVVANASRYYGVERVKNAASVGAFTAKLNSIFSQLVPSAQVETAILDVRTNQQSVAYVESGARVVETRTLAVTWESFNPRLHIGGGIKPGSLVMSTAFWPLLQDDGNGKLMVVPGGGGGNTPVGTHVANINYADGVLDAVFLAGGIYPAGALVYVDYIPAAPVNSVQRTGGFPITQANRTLNFVRTLPDIPVPGTLQVSYMAQGSWYTLQDNGVGELRGTDTAFGSGILNRTTGTIQVTMGALPDVDSAIIFSWAPPDTAVDSTTIQINNNGDLYFETNSKGEVTGAAGDPLSPGNLVLTWMRDGVQKTATDDGKGLLQGDARGTVDYLDGVIRMTPLQQPPKGTVVSIAKKVAQPSIERVATVANEGGVWSIAVGQAVLPGTLFLDVPSQRTFVYSGEARKNFGSPKTSTLQDDGNGGVYTMIRGNYRDVGSRLMVGTVNYATGVVTLNKATEMTKAQAKISTAFDNMYQFDFTSSYWTAQGI